MFGASETPVSGSAPRHRTVMDHKAGVLSDAAMVDLASYYSELPCRQNMVLQATAGPLAIARCAGCHGERGRSPLPDVPHLYGQKPNYLLNQIRAFREETLAGSSPLSMIQRRHPLMSPIGVRVSIDEARLIVAWYANQKCP